MHWWQQSQQITLQHTTFLAFARYIGSPLKYQQFTSCTVVPNTPLSKYCTMKVDQYQNNTVNSDRCYCLQLHAPTIFVMLSYSGQQAFPGILKQMQLNPRGLLVSYVFKKIKIFSLHRRFTVPACLPKSGLIQYFCPRWILRCDSSGITNTTLPAKGMCHIQWWRW